jgi:hypothetical protein
MTARRAATALIVVLAAASASAAGPDPKALSSFAFDASLPLDRRIEAIPDWLLSFWRQADEAPDYQAYQPTEDEKKEFSRIIHGLPLRMQLALRERAVGIYFVSNLKGNGLTDWVLDSKQQTYFYTILNPSGFQKSLSQTLAQRERSPFVGSPAFSIDVGEGGSGMIYSLSHELAHAFDYVEGLTPYTEPHHAKRLGRPLKVSWGPWAEYDLPRPESDFPARSQLAFYGFKPPKLDAAAAPDVCAQWAKSPFVSLYGSLNWADDAAELFVFYHLTRNLGRPYRVRCGDATFEPLSDPRRRDRISEVLQPLYGSP